MAVVPWIESAWAVFLQTYWPTTVALVVGMGGIATTIALQAVAPHRRVRIRQRSER